MLLLTLNWNCGLFEHVVFTAVAWLKPHTFVKDTSHSVLECFGHCFPLFIKLPQCFCCHNLMCKASCFEELCAENLSLWPWPNHLPLSSQQTKLMCSSQWLISLVFDDLVTKAYVSFRLTSSSSSSSSTSCLYHLSLTTPFSLNRQIEQVFTVGPKSNSRAVTDVKECQRGGENRAG